MSLLDRANHCQLTAACNRPLVPIGSWLSVAIPQHPDRLRVLEGYPTQGPKIVHM